MNKKKKKCTPIFRQITDLICFYVLIKNFTNVNNFPLFNSQQELLIFICLWSLACYAI